MPRQLHFRAPSQEELVQLRDLHDRGYYEAAFRAFMDPTGRRSSNRTLPLETQQAGFLAGYMLLREALDEQRQVGSPLTHLKLTWTNSTELDNLDHIDRCFIQELFKWLFTLPLGQMQLAVSEVPRDLHQDSKDLVAKRACRLPAIAAGMQLHPVEDKCCDSALGELLVKRGGVRAWLRLATLAGRIRTVQVVQWALDHENFLRNCQEIEDFTQRCPTVEMVGEVTTELSLLKPSKQQVFNSYLCMIFSEPEWRRLEEAVLMGLHDPGTVVQISPLANGLASLHLIGEFALNNILQFWHRLAGPQLLALKDALDSFSTNMDDDHTAPELPYQTRCWMSTNTIQFTTMSFSSGAVAVTKQSRQHFAKIARLCRRLWVASPAVQLKFRNGQQRTLRVPRTWRSWTTLQRSTCKAAQVWKAICTQRVRNYRKVRATSQQKL